MCAYLHEAQHAWHRSVDCVRCTYAGVWSVAVRVACARVPLVAGAWWWWPLSLVWAVGDARVPAS